MPESSLMPQDPSAAAAETAARAEEKDAKSSIHSLAKGLKVLEAFSSGGESMTLSQIDVVAHLDAGTTYRILNTLVKVGYIVRIPDSRRFRLSLKVLDLGFNAIAHSDLRALIRPLLQSLVDEVNEAANFAVLEGGDVLYIERVRAGITRLGVDIRIGTTIPASITLIGRTILAYLPEPQLEKTIATPPRHPVPQIHQPDRQTLAALLEQIRKDGYSVGIALTSPDLRLLSVPVLRSDGSVIGAISVTAPAVFSSNEDLLSRALQPMQAVAQQIVRAQEATGVTSHILAERQ